MKNLCKLKRARSSRTIKIVAALFLASIIPGSALAKKKKRPPGPPADLPGQVNYYAQKLLSLYFDQSPPITQKIQELVLGDLDVWMGSRKPTFAEVRQHLEESFSKLHYPLEAEATAFTTAWNGSELIVAGYSLRWTDVERANLIALYLAEKRVTRRAGVSDFVPRTDLHFLQIPQDAPASFRFIAYGSRLGKSHPRLSATLYSFDGHTLKALWERRDAFDGKIEVNGEEVIITYLNEDEYIRATEQGQLPARHEAIYKLTPTGMALVTIRDIPF